jgi:hypothetical protein
VSIVTRKYSVDLASLPKADPDLVIQIERTSVNGNEILLLSKNSDDGVEPLQVRFATGMVLNLADGTTVGTQGQLVITGERVLGLITDGKVGDDVINESIGSIFTFVFDLDDIGQIESKSNWRGKPVELVFHSKENQSPIFSLQVFSVVAVLKSDGSLIRAGIETLREQFSESRRKTLQGR